MAGSAILIHLQAGSTFQRERLNLASGLRVFRRGSVADLAPHTGLEGDEFAAWLERKWTGGVALETAENSSIRREGLVAHALGILVTRRDGLACGPRVIRKAVLQIRGLVDAAHVGDGLEARSEGPFGSALGEGFGVRGLRLRRGLLGVAGLAGGRANVLGVSRGDSEEKGEAQHEGESSL